MKESMQSHGAKQENREMLEREETETRWKGRVRKTKRASDREREGKERRTAEAKTDWETKGETRAYGHGQGGPAETT